MRICISYGLCDTLSRDKSLNLYNTFCFGLISMPNFSTIHIGHWDSFYILISDLFKYGYPINIACSKTSNICKTRRMVTKYIPLGYENNYDKIAI